VEEVKKIIFLQQQVLVVLAVAEPHRVEEVMRNQEQQIRVVVEEVLL
jgi:hypothetical protein